jgi:hypothetical protein
VGTFHNDDFSLLTIHRAEALNISGSTISFNDLRLSIKALQTASLKLDLEKEEAIAEFQKMTHIPYHDGLKLILNVFQTIRSFLPFLKPINSSINANSLKKAAERVDRVNKKLMAFERGLLSEEGLPRREWFRHLVVAPGEYLGESPIFTRWLANQRLRAFRIWCYNTSGINRSDHYLQKCFAGFLGSSKTTDSF